MRKLLSLILACIMLVGQLAAQNRTVTGKITDQNGTPIPNASVTIKGRSAGTTSEADGSFTLTVPSSTRNLVISSVGFTSTEASIGSLGIVNISLSLSNANLENIVVTGYTSQRKSEFTGASAKVGADKIDQVPMASIDQILQGRAPGLYIASSSGQPGAAAGRVNIRGVGSISGGTNPLYVIDGIPVETGVFRTLNPNDFQSVDVLKDAAGTSLYGSRGANGVIVITTKKGRAGKTRLQYRAQGGINKPVSSKFDMMNTAQRLQFEEQILGPSNILPVGNTGRTGYPGWDYSPSNPRYNNLSAAQKQSEAALLDSIKTIDTDWPSFFFRDGTFQSHEVNASGGSDNLSFYTSLGYYNQEGTILRSSLDRYTFRANLDFKSDRLTVSVRSNAGWSTSSGIESEGGVNLGNSIAAAYLTLPYERLYNTNGNINVAAGRIGPNAFDLLNTTTNITNQFKGALGVTAILNVWNGISLKTTSGVDYRNNNTSRYIDPNSFVGRQVARGQQGSYNEGNSENVQFITTSGITFDQTFNEKHKVNAQALLEFVKNKNRSFNATGYGLNNKLPNTPAAIAPGNTTNNFIPLIGGGKTQNAIYSLMALANYSYDRRYTVSGSLRRDAPSQVPEAYRNNIFWSAGASWNIISEKFMENVNVLQDLALRASYGSSANANGFTSNFGYISSYGSASYAGTPSIVPASPGNPEYKLESQTVANIGLDLAAWNRRVRVTLDVYKKQSENLFVNQQLSRTTGFNVLSTNAAEVTNKGVELLVNVDVVSNKNLLVTVGGNAAYLKNEITSLGQLTEFVSGTGIFRVGLPIGAHYTVGYLGVDPQTGNPIYEDSTGKSTTQYLASNSRATYGTYLPKYQGGITIDSRYKNLDVSVLFSFASGVKRFNNERFFYEGGNNLFQYNQAVNMLNVWRKAGDATNLQRIGVGSTRQFSSQDVNDASFLRLRNVNVGYTFNFNNDKPIRGFRVYAQATNLLTWTKWTGFDPEEADNIATYEYPNARTYTVGLDVNF